MKEISERAMPDARATTVLVHAEEGYTANVPLADLDRDSVLLATHHDGDPLTADHGFPVRLIVPHLYGWKSVKWAARAGISGTRPSGILGTEWISHVRRSLEGTEILTVDDRASSSVSVGGYFFKIGL